MSQIRRMSHCATPRAPEYVRRCGLNHRAEFVHRSGSSHPPVQRHLYHNRLRTKQSTVPSPFSSKDERSFVQGFWDYWKKLSVIMRPASSETTLWTMWRCSLFYFFSIWVQVLCNNVKEEHHMDCFLLFWSI